MSATIKLTLSDYSVRERLDGWWRIPTVAQYLYPNGETQQFMNMLDELVVKIRILFYPNMVYD